MDSWSHPERYGAIDKGENYVSMLFLEIGCADTEGVRSPEGGRAWRLLADEVPRAAGICTYLCTCLSAQRKYIRVHTHIYMVPLPLPPVNKSVLFAEPTR